MLKMECPLLLYCSPEEGARKKTTEPRKGPEVRGQVLVITSPLTSLILKGPAVWILAGIQHSI